MHTDDPSNLRGTLADFMQHGYFVPLRLGPLSILLHVLLLGGRVNRQRKYTGWPLFFHTPRKVHLEVESTFCGGRFMSYFSVTHKLTGAKFGSERSGATVCLLCVVLLVIL